VAKTREELEAIRRSHADVWLVYTLPIELRTYVPEVWDAVQAEFEVVRTFPGTLGDGAVNVCRNRRATPRLS
jgi:hypothetical protein